MMVYFLDAFYVFFNSLAVPDKAKYIAAISNLSNYIL